MNKNYLINLLESSKKDIKQPKITSKDVINLLEANLISNDRSSTGNTELSSRPDIMELDSKSEGGNKLYNISERDNKIPANAGKLSKETPKPDKIGSESPNPSPKKPDDGSDTDLIGKPSDRPTPQVPSEPEVKPDEPEVKSEPDTKATPESDILRSDLGIPEIIYNDLNTINEDVGGDVIDKSQIKTLKTAPKTACKRNVLLCKETEINGEGEIKCFTTTKNKKGGLNSDALDTEYIKAYYRPISKITRPNTNDVYVGFGVKNYVDMPEFYKFNGKDPKYGVFYKEDGKNIIAILSNSQFNLLFKVV